MQTTGKLCPPDGYQRIATERTYSWWTSIAFTQAPSSSCILRDVIFIQYPPRSTRSSSLVSPLHHPSQSRLKITNTLLPCHRVQKEIAPFKKQRKNHTKGKKVKVKVWVLVIALLTRLEQQRFTISEVAADWRELMIPWRIMQHTDQRWRTTGPAVQHTDIPPPQSAH